MQHITGGNGRLKRLNGLALGIAVILGLFVLAILFISVYPFEPITFHDATLLQNTVKAGGTLRYYANFTKHANKVGNLSRYLISLNGESTIMLNSGLADAKTSENKKLNSVEIPASTQPGKYKVKVVVMYEYFGIRQIRTSFETPTFEVK